MKISNEYFTWRWFLLRLTSVIILSPVFMVSGFIVGTKEYFKHSRYRSKKEYGWYIAEAFKAQIITIVLFVFGGHKGIPKEF